MATVERIKQLLNCAERVPVKDGAGVVVPAGVDASIRAKAIQECLKIAEDEERKRG